MGAVLERGRVLAGAKVRELVAGLVTATTPEPAGTRTKVTGVWGREFPITAGVRDRASIEAFTHGQCLAVAIVLCHLTGWPIVAVLDFGSRVENPYATDNERLLHLGVLRPDGMLVDVRGARSLTAVTRTYFDEYYDADEFGAVDDIIRIRIVRARLLKLLLADPKVRRPALSAALALGPVILRDIPPVSSPLVSVVAA
jgi:hypothetical protein